jgi:hypothetical protein
VKLEANVKVAHARRIHSRKTTSSQMKNLTTFRSRGNVKSNARRNSRNFDIGAKDQLRIRDEHFAIQVFAVALETRILFNLEYNQNVAATTAARTDVARASHGHVLTGRHTGRNMNLDLLVLSNATFSATLPARR